MGENSEKCCCCCKMRTGIMLILICDILALISYIINAILVARLKDDEYQLLRLITDYLMDHQDAIEEEIDLRAIAYASLDMMIAIPSLMICIVFFPRLVVYIYMRNQKDGYSRRRIMSLVRIITTVL